MHEKNCHILFFYPWQGKLMSDSFLLIFDYKKTVKTAS